MISVRRFIANTKNAYGKVREDGVIYGNKREKINWLSIHG